MKTWVLLLALFTLCLAATSVVAQNDLYDNGPTDGQTLGWAINFGFAVSDQFALSSDSTVSGITFAAWLFPGDTLQSVEVSITSSEFGGTSFFDQTVNFTASGCFSNAGGFNVCNETGTFGGVALNAGSYWLNLANGVTATGNAVFWDMNSGPSLASENSVGTIPSESFTLFTSCNQNAPGCVPPPSTPEPNSLLLIGSGGMALLGASGLRRLR